MYDSHHMDSSYSSTKDLFQQAIDDLKSRNPQLSMRAIAKRLSAAPSYVSEVLSGKKSLSTEMAARIAEKLKFNQEHADLFIALAELESSKDDALRKRLAARITSLRKRADVKKITSTQFSLISDWYYFGILELSQLPEVKLTPALVSDAFGISVDAATAAIDKLIENGLLVRGADRSLRKSDARINVSAENRNDDLRKFHKQFLAKAIDAVDTQNTTEKFIGSETFAFDSTQLSTANQIIEECFSRLVLLASESTKKDSVYHAGIQLFRLSKEQL